MDFEKLVKVFSIKEPYYGIILSSMNRKAMPEVGTIGVRRSGGVFELNYNPDFIKNIPDDGMMELLKHECLHICLNHVTLDTELGVDSQHWDIFNMAIDMEANSYINTNITKAQIPGGYYADQFGWDKSLGAVEYYRRLLDMQDQQSGGDDDEDSELDSDNKGTGSGESNAHGQGQEKPDTPGGSKPFDSHDNWPKTFDGISGEKEIDIELLKSEIEQMVIKAAEEVSVKDPGSVPMFARVLIEQVNNRKKPKPVCDWRRYFRRYVGNAFTDMLRKSRKRPSKRFPDAAGNRHQRTCHVLVAIDTSGSINNKEYNQFMEQMKTLSEKASFRVIECDTQITKEYEFNGRVQDVVGGGGTSFQPPVDYFLKNRKLFDKLIYFTDGFGNIPKNTPKDTLWVITSDGDQENRKKYTVNGASVVFIKDNK